MSFDPNAVNLTTANPRDIVCYLQLGENEYNGYLGARISAVFVMFILSTGATMFPVLGKRFPQLRIPIQVYLFARYFGTGVIVATAFIHLLDPAYQAIGPNSCVGMTGGWAAFSWPPAIMLAAAMAIFLVDVAAQKYVVQRFGLQGEPRVECLVTDQCLNPSVRAPRRDDPTTSKNSDDTEAQYIDKYAEIAFAQQIAAFLILEFGIVWHSVFIGLNFGVAGEEWSTLYIVLMFHQGFEGLGIGARLSAIPFPQKLGRWLPWALCLAYGLTTPIAMAIGLGVRTTYNSGSFTANVVSGIFDSMSAGILVYNGMVELLARDFIFEPQTRDNRRLTFMLVCVLLGAGIMSLLAKWA